MRRSQSTLHSSSFLTSNILALTLCVLVFSTFSFAAAPDRVTGPIGTGQLTRLAAGVPLQAKPAYDRGPVDPAFKLTYMTLLTVPSPSQQHAIDQLLAEQQDPRSPLFHKWLTPQEYAEQFGLSPNDVQKITAWLQSEGFHIENVALGRNWIVFSGNAAQVANAFQTEIHKFNVNGEEHFSNTKPISIPAALSSVVAGIRGLSDFRPKSYIEHRLPQYTYPVPRTNPQLYYLYLAPDDVKTIYDIGPLYNAGIDGTGQTLAVVGQTDIYLSDLTEFRTGFHLPAIPNGSCSTNSRGFVTSCSSNNSANLLQYVLLGTDPGTYTSLDDLAEADLDLEWSGATARNAQIVYVNAPATANGVWDAWYHAVDHNLAPVISMSYGNCELAEAQYGVSHPGQIGTFGLDEAELKKANLQGITFVNSSGDSGAAECDPPASNGGEVWATQGLAVSYPASSPEVTGVGGTSIPFSEYDASYWSLTNGPNGGSAQCPNATGPCIPEAAWNDIQEIGAYCAANPGSSGCSGITDAQTAQLSLGLRSATGGGASNCYTLNSTTGKCMGGFPQPAWQSGLSIPGQSTPARFTPDLSLLASPNLPGYIWCSNASCVAGIPTAVAQDSIVGGTSASAPVFAGMMTLMNQYVVNNGFQATLGLGNANPSLYHIATYNQASGAFNGVTASDFPAAPGSNQIYCQSGTPAVQPVALACPSPVSPATQGLFGFLSSDADATTGYNVVTGLGSVNADNLATAWGNLLTASTTSIVPSASAILAGSNETFTITMTPSTAGGVVTFYVNGSTTALGTATVTGGTGTFSTTALPAGTDSVVASYIGTNASSNSSAVSVQVTQPDFVVTNTGSTSTTVKSGLTAAGYSFTVSPKAPATTFGATVTFSCSFSPSDPTLTNSSCVFNPASIAGTATGPQTVTLTITTTGPNTGGGSQLRRRADNRSPRLPLALPLAGIVMAGFAGRKIGRYSALAGLGVSLILLGLLVACGGGGTGSTSTPPVTVSVTGSPTSVFPNNTGWSPSQTAQFTANVTNTTNTAVNWSLSSSVSCAGTPSPCGSVSSSGLYTAPTIAAGLPGSVTVIATSQADTTKSGSATETISPATVPGAYGVTVTVTDSTPTPIQHTLPFTLNVQ